MAMTEQQKREYKQYRKACRFAGVWHLGRDLRGADGGTDPSISGRLLAVLPKDPYRGVSPGED